MTFLQAISSYIFHLFPLKGLVGVERPANCPPYGEGLGGGGKRRETDHWRVF
jgi:hypothetical protein